MKLRKILLGMVLGLVLLLSVLSVFSQDKWEGVDYNELSDVDRVEYLRDNYGIEVIGGVGMITVTEDRIMVGGATLSLGSSTTAPVIFADQGAIIEVTGGDGYSGKISTWGKMEIKAWTEQGAEKITVGEEVEIENGRIVKGKKIEVLEPSLAFAGVPKGKKVSLREGNVDGNKFESTLTCVDVHCFQSKEENVVEIGSSTIKVSGKNVKHREENKLERVISSEKGATLDLEDNWWELSGGTQVTEIKGSGASVTVQVKEGTGYFPKHDRRVCDSVSGSCVAIDTYNSMRVKAEGNNEIKINSYQITPQIIVDKIKDDSSVEYTEHKLWGNDGELSKLVFDAEGVKNYPPASLKGTLTHIVFDYDDKKGKAKVLRVDTAGKNIEIKDIESKTKKIVTHYDKVVARNYYATSLGVVINTQDIAEYEKIILEKLGRDAFKKLTPEEKDLLMLSLQYDWDNRDKLEELVMGFETYVKTAPEGIDKGVLFRGLIRDYEGGPLSDLIDDIELFSTNHLLNAQLMQSYEEGKLNSLVIMDFHNEMLTITQINTPEKTEAHLSLLLNLPKEDAQVHTLLIEGHYLHDLINNYYDGNEDQELILLKEMNSMAEGGKISDKTRLDLRLTVTEEELTNLLLVMRNLEKVKGGFDSKEKNRLQVGLELQEKAPQFMKMVEEFDEKRRFITSYFFFENKIESGEKISEGQEILRLLDEALKNPSISKETKDSLKKYYQGNSDRFSSAVNRLAHSSSKLRTGLVNSLPDEMKIEILSHLTGLGTNDGLYRSSEELIFKDLTRDIGGEDKLIDYLETQGYDLNHEKTGRVLSMLASCGQLGKVIPKEETKQKEVYQMVLGTLAKESPAKAGDTAQRILKNPQLRDVFTETFLEEYETTIREGKDDEKRDVLQYLLRQNKKYFDEENQIVKSVLENPSQEVLDVENKLIIPISEMVQNSDKREGIPVLKAAVAFTDLEEDSAMRTSFEQFKNVGGGFKLVTTTKEGYVLEREGTIVNEMGETVPVIFRMETFSDAKKSMRDIGPDSSYFFIVNKGHSYSSGEAWNNQKGYKNDIPRIGYVGSCVGFNDINEKDLTHIYKNTAFFATAGTGTARINNNNIKNIFGGLEEGNQNYQELWAYVKERAGTSEKAEFYTGPETFFVNDLKRD
ncbi:hypothetical protein GOV03_05070 [Candidatus Woesearchaeota archaeon]|nr:hypothetical protein [Candidatus Woesearchaeota archaeon]